MDILSKAFPEYFVPGDYLPIIEPGVFLELSKVFGLKVPAEVDEELSEIYARCRFEFPCIETMLRKRYICFKIVEIA